VRAVGALVAGAFAGLLAGLALDLSPAGLTLAGAIVAVIAERRLPGRAR
jgi:hypothetical protein